MSPSLADITKGLLQTYGRFPRKNLGQHFLIDPDVLRRIVRAAEINKDDVVLSGNIPKSLVDPLFWERQSLRTEKAISRFGL